MDILMNDGATSKVEDGRAIRPAKGPAFNYYGGKWNLADWIIGFFPRHRYYVEPFGGAASVLLRKNPSDLEVYNDLAHDVHNFFRVLRDESMRDDLIMNLGLTPLGREEFEESLQYGDDDGPVEKARKFFIKTNNSIGKHPGLVTRHNFDLRQWHEKYNMVNFWNKSVRNLRHIVDRFSRVLVENKPALEIIDDFDREGTLFYLDPPYPRTTRNHYFGAYGHEMSDDDHAALAGRLGDIRGMAIVSGYRCPLYDELYKDWPRHDRETQSGQNKRRVESIWLSRNMPRTNRLF